MLLLPQTIPKSIFFAVFGALGCVFGAVIGEAALALLLPQSSQPAVDVLFVLDTTMSMSNEIDGVKNGIANFVANLGKRDVRVGLVAFGDQCLGEENKVLSFPGGAFTHDTTAFSLAVGGVPLTNGGDGPETSLDALILAASQSFAPAASKAIVLITDAPPHVQGRETAGCGKASGYRAPAEEDAIHALSTARINQLHLVVASQYQPWFAALHAAIPGDTYPLEADGRQNFARLLPKIGERIAMAIGTGSVDAAQGQTLALATAAWTAPLAVGALLFLIAAQNLYLRRKLAAFDRATLAAVFGAAAAGALAGAAGQWLAQAVDAAGAVAGAPARILAWAVLGGVLSRGIACFIPNLSASRAVAGGVLGGALGAVGFACATSLGFEGRLGDALGRFIGAALLGLLIGLMISIVERVFREFWLEVTYGPKEIRTVNLGAEPVSFGGDAAACTVYAAGAAPQAYAYRIERGHVVCQDLAAGRGAAVQPGHQRQIGKLTVAVCGMAVKVVPFDPAPPPPNPPPAQGLALRVAPTRAFSLTVGRRFTSKDIAGLTPQSGNGVVAEVTQNPKDPALLGLKNCSDREWLASMPDGQTHRVAPGKNVKLAAGGRIAFGSVEGEVTMQGGA